MTGGDSIPASQLSVEGSDTGFGSSGDVTAGDTATGASDADTDGQITVNWESEDGSQSATLATFDV